MGSNPAKRTILNRTDLCQPRNPFPKHWLWPIYGRLAQLVRAPALHAGGHWFESSTAHFLRPWCTVVRTQVSRPMSSTSFHAIGLSSGLSDRTLDDRPYRKSRYLLQVVPIRRLGPGTVIRSVTLGSVPAGAVERMALAQIVDNLPSAYIIKILYC